MPPQEGLLAGFATGLLSLQRHLRNVLPDQVVTILDLSAVDPEAVRARIEDVAGPSAVPLLFGVTTTTATYQASLAVAEMIKAVYGANATVLFGGHHATADTTTILAHHNAVDLIITGEGEKALEALLRSWPDLSGVPQLHRRDSQGMIISGASAPLLTAEELDQIDLDETWFCSEHHPGKFDHFTYVSARGCPLKCRFCSVANQQIRGKTPSVIARDLRKIVAHGYTRIAFEDNFFAHAPARTRSVCDALRALRCEGLEFNWDCQTRIEAVCRPGVPRLLVEAGCDAVYLGVEALTERALQYLGKAPNAERYFRQLSEVAVPSLLDAGLRVYMNLQLGLPDEAGDSPVDTLRLLHALGRAAREHGGKLTVFPQLFVLYPGTAHFQEYLAQKIIWPEVFEDLTAWECGEQDLRGWMGRHFAHGVGGLALGVMQREALLRRQFEVDWRAMLSVTRQLEDLQRIPGIAVFNYADHLAPLTPDRSANLERTTNA